MTIMLTAVSMGAALGHLLEMPAKLTLDGAMWLTLLQRLYSAFGTVGGTCEAGALFSAVVLVFLVSHRRPAFLLTVVAAVCLVAAHAAFWIFVAPVNATMATFTPATLPPDWTRLRDQWEYTHAARAGLQIIALAALVLSIVVETPTQEESGRSTG